MEMELAYQRIWIPWLRDSTGGKKPSLDGQRYVKWSDRSILLLNADAKSLADSTPGLSGVGFVIPPGYAVIDLDDCFNEDGNLKPAARTIVNTLGSYSEYSPSKKGVHVIARADLQGFSKLATNVNGQSTEVLTPGNFVTFTGLSLGSPMPEIIADCTSVLEEMYADAGVTRWMNKPQSVSDARVTQHQCSYGSKCLESECDRIRKAHVGSRTNSLLKGSYRMGRLIDHIDESVAIRELQRAGESTGLSRDKVSRTIADGLSEGKTNPRTDVNCGPIRITL